MFLRVEWPGGRRELLRPVPWARLKEVSWIIDEIDSLWESEGLWSGWEGLGHPLSVLTAHPWGAECVERLLNALPLVLTEKRLTLSDFGENLDGLQALLFGSSDDEGLGLIAQLHIAERERFDYLATGETVPIEEIAEIGAFTLAQLSQFDGTVAGAFAILEKLSAGDVTALIREKADALDPTAKKRRVAEKTLKRYCEENAEELDRQDAEFFTQHPGWKGWADRGD